MEREPPAGIEKFQLTPEKQAITIAPEIITTGKYWVEKGRVLIVTD